MENIQPLLTHKNFKFINHDIIQPITTISGNIHEIYHLACPASPPKYQIDPIYTLKINFTGTMNLLELARQKNSRILFSSTSEVYGEPEKTPEKIIAEMLTQSVFVVVMMRVSELQKPL